MAKAKDRTREIGELKGGKKGTPRRRKDEDSRKGQVRGRWYASPAFLPSLLIRHPASPITTRRCPTVGRFTYKFNKHISYLMHALSRECFDRPGPSFSSSTRSAFSPSHASLRANSSTHRSLPSTRLCASRRHRMPEVSDPHTIVFSQLGPLLCKKKFFFYVVDIMWCTTTKYN